MATPVKTPQAKYIFETSWEVCNKVGGIYTVLISKAAQTVARYGAQYFVIGPYFENKARGEFQEIEPEGIFKSVFDELAKTGIVCHLGTWLIEGEPRAILIDFSKYWNRENEIKKTLWEWDKIDSLLTSFDYTEPVIFAWTAGKLLEALSKNLVGEKMVAQFHEWMTGSGLLYLAHEAKNVRTVFTTHATVLGRAIAASNEPLYDMLSTIDADESAKQHGVLAKHLIEKQSALRASVFTTVSGITALEAKHILGKNVDVVLCNGLDMEKFPTLDEIALKHRIQNRRLREFVESYFFPYYSFNIQETQFYFTLGRYEFHNKGIDLYIRALGELNKRLQVANSAQTIVAFILVPSGTAGIRPEVIAARDAYRDIADLYAEVSEDVTDAIRTSIISDDRYEKEVLFHAHPDFVREMKKKIMKFRRNGVPPLATHVLTNANDAIVRACEANGLGNRPKDRVKIVFYPDYLNGSDGILNLDYYESITAMDFGVFPSFYEPWGYTPLEAAALGVPSVTTDLAGFGRFLSEQKTSEKNAGVYVLNRLHATDEETVAQLTDILSQFATMGVHERIENKIKAQGVAERADWSVFIENYIEAHNKSLE